MPTTDFKIESKEELRRPKFQNGSKNMVENFFNKLIIVSNRLPITVNKGDNGRLEVRPSSNHLVTAALPSLWDNKCLWIGWPGSIPDVLQAKHLDSAGEQLGCTLEPVILSEFVPSEKEFDNYYLGFANKVLWPLFHGFPQFCKASSGYWYTYQEINRKFAYKLACISKADDYIWVQDYNFMLLAKELSDIGIKRHTGFVLQTPFPSYDIFKDLPWHKELIEALLDYDMIGFQTQYDRDNFIRCTEEFTSLDYMDEGNLIIVKKTSHQCATGVFPIGIDFSEFEKLAADGYVEELARQLKGNLPDCRVILGVDELDCSRGIPLRLNAYRTFLNRFEDVRGKVIMTQIVIPGSDTIPEYYTVKKETEDLVREINGGFGDDSWLPVRCINDNLDKSELAAHYRAADIALFTPVMDEMNLVSKEYCAATIDNDGVLILSEFSGSARQLNKNALIVNPGNINLLADTLYQAFQMPAHERNTRMRRLRRSISRQDIYWWSNLFLRSAQQIARRNMMTS